MTCPCFCLRLLCINICSLGHSCWTWRCTPGNCVSKYKFISISRLIHSFKLRTWLSQRDIHSICQVISPICKSVLRLDVVVKFPLSIEFSHIAITHLSILKGIIIYNGYRVTISGRPPIGLFRLILKLSAINLNWWVSVIRLRIKLAISSMSNKRCYCELIKSGWLVFSVSSCCLILLNSFLKHLRTCFLIIYDGHIKVWLTFDFFKLWNWILN